jgi:hypothetical protein
MRLDFNVLWVDDQPNLVASQVVALRRAMAEEGFDLNHTFCQTMDEVVGRLGEDVFRDEIDMILVDWNLGSGARGEDVITRIRVDVPYKDVIFYSAEMDVSQLRDASFKVANEGVYFVTRDALVTEATHLFRSMIKKILDIDHARGIVMGATSDVDQTARDCLALAHDLLDDGGKAGVLAEMLDMLGSKPDKVKRDVDKLSIDPAVGAIIAKYQVFTAHDALQVLRRLLDLPQFASLAAHREHVNTYMQKVVPHRNILGHRVLSPDGKPGIAGPEVGQIITIDEVRALRKLLLELRNQFKALHTALNTPAQG